MTTPTTSDPAPPAPVSTATDTRARRIVVVTGSTRLRRLPPLVLVGAMASALSLRSPDLVAHGAAKGWDTYSDEFAQWAGITRAAFPLGAGERGPELWLPSGARRPVKNVDRYRYSAPYTRNEVLMRWAADQREAGHSVTVVACIAPWSGTGGTRHAIDRARSFELSVDLIVVPSDAWPEEDTATEGQHGA